MKVISLLRLFVPMAAMVWAPLAQAESFDGSWAVTLNTPEYKDPTGMVALGYTLHFPATVKDGELHGERGVKGQPAWLSIAGKINAQGDATLHVQGITDRSEYALGHVKSGHPYEYDVKAHFQAKEGKGTRIGGRLGYFTFVRA